MNPFFISLTIFLYALFFHPVYAKATDSTRASAPHTITQCKFIRIDATQTKIVKQETKIVGAHLVSTAPMKCDDPKWVPIGVIQHDLPKTQTTTNDRNWITDLIHKGNVFKESSQVRYYKPKTLTFANGVNMVDLICAPYSIDASTWREGTCP
jgi:hypothetical protein